MKKFENVKDAKITNQELTKVSGGAPNIMPPVPVIDPLPNDKNKFGERYF